MASPQSVRLLFSPPHAICRHPAAIPFCRTTAGLTAISSAFLSGGGFASAIVVKSCLPDSANISTPSAKRSTERCVQPQSSNRLPNQQRKVEHRIRGSPACAVDPDATGAGGVEPVRSNPQRRQNLARPRIIAKHLGHSISMKVWAGMGVRCWLDCGCSLNSRRLTVAGTCGRWPPAIGKNLNHFRIPSSSAG